MTSSGFPLRSFKGVIKVEAPSRGAVQVTVITPVVIF